jgi:hypothetical protein
MQPARPSNTAASACFDRKKASPEIAESDDPMNQSITPSTYPTGLASMAFLNRFCEPKNSP